MSYLNGFPQMIGNLVTLKIVSDVALKVAKVPSSRTRTTKRRK